NARSIPADGTRAEVRSAGELQYVANSGTGGGDRVGFARREAGTIGAEGAKFRGGRSGRGPTGGALSHGQTPPELFGGNDGGAATVDGVRLAARAAAAGRAKSA